MRRKDKNTLSAGEDLIGAYPSGWIWPDGDFDFMKCLIPFFDGLAIFMPADHVEQVINSDPYLAGPLFELGYLRNIDPDITLDEDLSNIILEMVQRFVQDERFSKVGSGIRQRIVGHLGYKANPQTVLDFVRNLQSIGLAGTLSRDGTFAVQSDVCTAIVENCFSALSRKMRSSGIDLVPVKPETNSDHGNMWEIRDPFFSNAIWLDLQEVGVDLRAVPLDEIIDFSSRYRAQYRAYLRGIREIARTLSNVEDEDEKKRVKRDRLEAIDDQRAFLQNASRTEFRRRSLSLLVSVAGSAWTLRTGDEVAAALAAASAAVGLAPSPQHASEYSYLFRVRDYGNSFQSRRLSKSQESWRAKTYRLK
jgi:hypothetical protein